MVTSYEIRIYLLYTTKKLNKKQNINNVMSPYKRMREASERLHEVSDRKIRMDPRSGHNVQHRDDMEPY